MGTSRATMRRASPSAIAVLPTPGSPMRTLREHRELSVYKGRERDKRVVLKRTSARGRPAEVRKGLTLVRRLRMRMVLRISESRPITGSSLPSDGANIEFYKARRGERERTLLGVRREIAGVLH